METTHRLEQKQKLSLTPEMRQRLAVLGMSAVELRDQIEKEVLENPTLEVDEYEPDASESGPEERDLSDEHVKALSDWDQDLASYEAGADWSVPGSDRDRPPTALDIAHEDATFEEYLLRQLGELPLQDETARAARAIISSLDQDGYFRGDLAEVASQSGVSETTAKSALKAVQALDPSGVGARDLAECLLIQLREIGDGDALAAKIVQEHLGEVAEDKPGAIARAEHVSPAKVRAALDVIKSLNPRPANAHGGDSGRDVVVPEFAVREVDGELVVLPIAEASPTLKVSRLYQSMVRSGSGDESTLDYLRARLQAAKRFVRDIERRKETLSSVAQATVRAQERFFRSPDGELVPLKLEDIAQVLGLHPSTVSRAVNGKYVDSARGVIELRRLFGGGLPSADGSISTDSVRRRDWKQLIAAEPHDAPFSDARLTELLKAQGVSISRRTVAKYREQMRIPGSWRRKKP